jgi:hypothetical protein
MTESQTHHRFALSPSVRPGRVLAAALVAAALAPAAASAQPADAGPVPSGPRPQVVLTGIAGVQHQPDALAGGPQARGHDTSSLAAAPRPQVVATQDLRAPDQSAPGSVQTQDLRAPDQSAPGSVVQDQRAPDQVAPAPTPVATDDGGLDPGWIVLIAGAGVLLAAGMGLAGRRTHHLRTMKRSSIA